MTSDLLRLIELFHAHPEVIGQFRAVSTDHVPPPFRQLLAHDSHMTAAVEEYLDGPVQLHVVQERSANGEYAREILLLGGPQAAPVQYGIVRLQERYFPPHIRQQILAKETPLGHLLIRYDLLRKVELQQLWQIQPGPILKQHLGISSPDANTFGRSAHILVESQPAIELLEISAPLQPESPYGER